MATRNYESSKTLGTYAPYSGEIASMPWANTLDVNAVNNHPLGKWIPYFGVPESGIPAQSPGLAVARDVYNLPEAYRGQRNARIETILINQIQQSHKYPIDILFPLTEWNGTHEVTWDVWKFHDARLGRVPEQAVPRVTTSNFSEDRAYLIRLGLSFILEHGFMNTERGRTNYKLNLAQISNACVETLCHGAMVHAFAAKPVSFDPAQMRSHVSDASQRDDILNAENRNTNLMAKRQNGLSLVWDDLRERISRVARVEPNALVVPYGMMKLASQTRPESWFTFISGPNTNKSERPNLPGRVQVYESQNWRVGENMPSEDPAFQNRVFGFWHSFDARHLKHLASDPTKFRTEMMDRKIFSERANDFVDSKYWENVAKCTLFWHDYTAPLKDDHGGSGKKKHISWALTNYGMRFFKQWSNLGDYLRENHIWDKWVAQLRDDPKRRNAFFKTFALPRNVGRGNQTDVIERELTELVGSEFTRRLNAEIKREQGGGVPPAPRVPSGQPPLGELLPRVPGAPGSVPPVRERKEEEDEEERSGSARLANKDEIKTLHGAGKQVEAKRMEEALERAKGPDVERLLRQFNALFGDDLDTGRQVYAAMVLVPGKEGGRRQLSDKEFFVFMSVVEAIYMELATEAGADHQKQQNAVTAIQVILEEAMYSKITGPTLNAIFNDGQFKKLLDVPSFNKQNIVSQARAENVYNRFRKFAELLGRIRDSMSADIFDNFKLPEGLVKQVNEHGSLLAALPGNEGVLARLKRLEYATVTPADIQDVDPELVEKALIALPMSKAAEIVQFGLKHNMWPLLAIRAARPYATWTMGSAFACIQGGVTGVTMKQAADFMLGDNPMRKMHIGTFTMYAKTVIWRKDTIAIAPNIWAKGYIGGYDASIWDITNREDKDAYLNGNVLKHSIFGFPVPINEPEPDNYYDVTGKFVHALQTPQDPEPYTFADATSKAWRMQKFNGNPLIKNYINFPNDAISNTLVFRCHYQVNDVTSEGKDCWRDIWGAGCRGRYEYPGKADVWAGRDLYEKPLRDGTATMALIV